MPAPDKLLAVRNAIVSRKGEFRKIVESKDFKKNAEELWKDTLKTAPKGFPKDHPDIEYLKYKSFIAYKNMSDEMALSPKCLSYSVTVFKAMKPLIDFLYEAVQP